MIYNRWRLLFVKLDYCTVKYVLDFYSKITQFKQDTKFGERTGRN